MSVEPLGLLPSYTVAGTGPYAVVFPVAPPSSLRLSVVRPDGREIELPAQDWSFSAGAITLTAAAAAYWAGARLRPWRLTDPEQGWEAAAPREVGLQAQLDHLTRGLQDAQKLGLQSLRSPDPLRPFAPRANHTVIFDDELQPRPGPSAGQIAAAESHADRAERAAREAERAGYRPGSIDFALADLDDTIHGELLVALWDRLRPPSVPAGTSGFDPYRGATAQARANIQRAMRRLRQLSLIRWTPVAPFPRARSRQDNQGNPLYYPAGQQRRGVPYSSLQQNGDVPGLEVNLRAFRDATRNPHSVLYTRELFHADSGGRAFYGSNCSGFIAHAFGWPYYHATSRLARAWQAIGFVQRWADRTWDTATVAIGDIVVSRAEVTSGRHVEVVSAVTPTSIVLFDQAFEGPGETPMSYTAFLSRARSRGYDLLRWNWDEGDIPYAPDPDSPLPDEGHTAPPLNPVVTVDRGDSAVYAPEHDVGPVGWDGATIAIPDVTFWIMTAAAQTLVVSRNGDVVDTVALSGAGPVARHYDTAGDYSYHCVMADASLSPAGSFAIARVATTLSHLTRPAGQPVVLGFAAQNCTPELLYLTTVEFPDQPIWRRLTAAEIAAGQVSFTRTVPGTVRAYIYARHPGGLIYSHPRLTPDNRVAFT